MKAAVKFIAASVLAASATSVMAETGNWYAGLGAGQSKYGKWVSKSDMLSVLDEEADLLDVYALDGNFGTDSDDKDFGYKLFGGYKFGKNFAVEVSYIDTGEVTASSGASGYFYSGLGNFDGSVRNRVTGETDAFTVDALLTLPVANIAEIFFKVGAYRAESDVRISIAMNIEGDTIRGGEILSESSTGVHYGLGVDFNLTRNIALRAEWERLDGVDLDDADSDIDLLSASLLYRF